MVAQSSSSIIEAALSLISVREEQSGRHQTGPLLEKFGNWCRSRSLVRFVEAPWWDGYSGTRKAERVPAAPIRCKSLHDRDIRDGPPQTFGGPMPRCARSIASCRSRDRAVTLAAHHVTGKFSRASDDRRRAPAMRLPNADRRYRFRAAASAQRHSAAGAPSARFSTRRMAEPEWPLAFRVRCPRRRRAGRLGTGITPAWPRHSRSLFLGRAALRRTG